MMKTNAQIYKKTYMKELVPQDAQFVWLSVTHNFLSCLLNMEKQRNKPICILTHPDPQFFYLFSLI